MLIVYIPGCWDMLHVGHIRVLKAAKALGDKLVVGVASDAVVHDDKDHYPIIDFQQRREMVDALECVDAAFNYFELDFLNHLNLFRPDILAVGEMWGTDVRHQDAESWCKQNHCRLIQLPYTAGVSTSEIKERIQLQN